MQFRRWSLHCAALSFLLGCSREVTAPDPQQVPADTTTHRPTLVSTGPFHVLGYWGMVGEYHDTDTAVEIVNSRGGKITILSLFESQAPEGASGIALSIDGAKHRTELISMKRGTGRWLPMTFWTGGAERVRLDNAGRLGIGTEAPDQRLEVNGGVRLNPDQVRPACTERARGTLWFVRGQPGQGDQLLVCRMDQHGVLEWKEAWT